MSRGVSWFKSEESAIQGGVGLVWPEPGWSQPFRPVGVRLESAVPDRSKLEAICLWLGAHNVAWQPQSPGNGTFFVINHRAKGPAPRGPGGVSVSRCPLGCLRYKKEKKEKKRKDTNPNPKVRKGGEVGKAALTSMVLKEGSIGVARGGSSRGIRRPKNKGNERCAGCRLCCVLFVFAMHHQIAIMHFHRLMFWGGAHVRLCGGANFAPQARHGAPALLSACDGPRRLGRWRLFLFF